MERPKYQLLRFNEDWSVLGGSDRDAAEAGRRKDDPFDRIKYVPVGDRLWLSFGGQARSRVESWSNFGFDGGEDDTVWLNRFRYHVDVHATEYLRAFIEGKSAFSTDRDLPGGRRTTDVDELELQNGFLELRIPIDDASLTLRPGRQEFLFGNQRLVSPRDWSNVRRTWDGASFFSTLGDWTLTGFWAALVKEEKYSHNESDSGTQLYGVYAEGRMPRSGLETDFYFLGLRRDSGDVPADFNGTTGSEDRFTAGTRVAGAFGETRIDFELEGAYQFGEVGSDNINAFMVASELGYTLAIERTTRLFVGFDYASGDDSPGGDAETFNQLYPTGHKYLGHMDLVGRQNIIDLNTGLSLKPTKKLTTSLRGHFFWRASDDDAFYNAGGAVSRAGDLGNSRELGTELDVTARYDFDRHFFAQLGYGHFFPGEFIRESGSDDDVDFVYLTLQYTF